MVKYYSIILERANFEKVFHTFQLKAYKMSLKKNKKNIGNKKNNNNINLFSVQSIICCDTYYFIINYYNAYKQYVIF